MFLHNDKELFKDIITETASSLGIDPSIIEKDYYVTVFLKEIVNIQPDIVFKGGTSLSKCYKLISRFSEDIDLNIQCETRPTEGQRRHLKADIVSTQEKTNTTGNKVEIAEEFTNLHGEQRLFFMVSLRFFYFFAQKILLFYKRVTLNMVLAVLL